MQIRRATLDDAERAAAFHVDVWRRTYRTLAPFEAHRLLDAARRLPAWQRVCADDKNESAAWVAQDGARLCGVMAVGPASLPDMGARGEIKWLYVGPDVQRRGLGKGLLDTAFAFFLQRGLPGVALSVVQGNDPAIRFYEALGGACIGEMTDLGPIWKSKGWIYAWDF